MRAGEKLVRNFYQPKGGLVEISQKKFLVAQKFLGLQNFLLEISASFEISKLAENSTFVEKDRVVEISKGKLA